MESRGEINISRRHLFSDDKPESPNLRDYLRIRQDENFNDNSGDGRANLSRRTLSSAFKTEERSGESLRSQSNRTLLDVIRDDPTGGSNTKDGKRSWKHIREKLRLRRQGSGNAWTPAVPVPASDVPLQPSTSRNRMAMMTRRDSTRMMNMPVPDGSHQPDVDLSRGVSRSRSAMLQRESRAMLQRENRAMLQRETYDDDDDDDAADEETERERVEEEEHTEEDEGETGEAVGGGAQPERMSLMDLLAETDKQMGLDGYMMEDDEDEDDEDDGGAGAGAGGGYNNCCVCMVRHKGAAFIPCGHTFCRLCSRELWVQRGNCPLCNNFILEILDIF